MTNPNAPLPVALDVALALLANATTALNAAGVIIEQLRGQPAAASEEPAAPGVTICRHEKRIGTATAGKPNAWMCGDCEFEGEG